MRDRELIKSSVIIPVYNTKEYLDECIQSVLSQTQKEFEIIVVDDGSTDGSSEVIDEYQKKYDNIIAIHQTNQKLGAARNAGIQAARGKYIYCMDSDDYIREDLLEECYRYAEEKEADFVFFDAYAFWEKAGEKCFETTTVYDRSKVGIIDKVYTGAEYWEQYYKRRGVITVAQLNYIRKDFLEANKLMFEPGVFYEDNDWIARMHIHGKKIYYISEQLYYRRYRPGSIMQSTYSDTHWKSAVFMFEKLLNLCINENSDWKRNIYENVLWSISTLVKKIIEETDCFLKEKGLFLERLLETSSELEVLTQVQYIKILFFIVSISKKISVSPKAGEKLELVKNKILDYMEINFRLNQRINIGICGTGKRCAELFDWYERNDIPILANVSFMVQEPQTNRYRGYPVCSYAEAANVKYDHIIIASTKYVEEIEESLRYYQIESENVYTVLPVLSYF